MTMIDPASSGADDIAIRTRSLHAEGQRNAWLYQLEKAQLEQFAQHEAPYSSNRIPASPNVTVDPAAELEKVAEKFSLPRKIRENDTARVGVGASAGQTMAAIPPVFSPEAWNSASSTALATISRAHPMTVAISNGIYPANEEMSWNETAVLQRSSGMEQDVGSKREWEEHLMHVSKDGNTVTIAIRDGKLTPYQSMNLVYRVASDLAGAGFQLRSATVNGQLAYRSREQSSLNAFSTAMPTDVGPEPIMDSTNNIAKEEK